MSKCDDARPTWSLVIPAYNEERRLPPTLETVLAWFDDQAEPYQVIVVDDGSTDRMVEVVRDRFGDRVDLLTGEPNRGKGFAVRRGMLHASGDLIGFSDADLSAPIEELPKLAAALEGGAQVAIGSRGLPDDLVEVYQPWWRRRMGQGFNLLVRMLVVGGLHDTQCGFKLFRREAAAEVFPRQRVMGFAFDVEVLYLARRLGLEIAEVPVRWVNEPESKVHPVWSSLRMLCSLLGIRLRALCGGYGKLAPGPREGARAS